MKKKLALFVAAVLTAVSLSVPRADADWCVSGGTWCGGLGKCCIAVLGFCFAWSCDK